MQRSNHSDTIRFLDGLRGLAALYVMIGHARWLLWEGYSQGFKTHPQDYTLLEKIGVYGLSLFSYGHEAVLLFFVLSGFVIHLSYSKKLFRDQSTNFDTVSFFWRRIRRIYPPFLFTLVLTYVLDTIGQRAGYSIYFGQTPNELINHNIRTDHSFINLLGNLFFYENPRIGIWGTNGPLWSLKYEWWFYMLYPILFLVNRRNIKAAIFLVLFLFAAGTVLGMLQQAFFFSVFQMLLFWYLGAIAADIYTGRFKISYRVLSVFTLGLPLGLMMSKFYPGLILTEFAWSLGFFGLINAVIGYNSTRQQPIRLTGLAWLGNCSYTLYIIHFPLFVLFNGLLLAQNGNQMPKSLTYCFIGIFGAVALAYLLHFIIEQPFISKHARQLQAAPPLVNHE